MKFKMEENKQIVIDLYSRVFGQGDTRFADSIIEEGYIQHSPMVKTGKSGFMEFMAFLKQIPKPKSPVKPFMRMFSEGNFVVVHLEIEFMGELRSVLDLFRLEGGVLVEHWDATEKILGDTSNGNSVVKGTQLVEDKNLTDEHKGIVRRYSQIVLLNKQWDRWKEFLSPSLIQHNQELKNGALELRKYYEGIEVQSTHHIIGEGNFVLTQSKGLLDALPYVIYDIYRLKDRLIQEHWSVKQLIPVQMAHSNGMI